MKIRHETILELTSDAWRAGWRACKEGVDEKDPNRIVTDKAQILNDYAQMNGQPIGV